LDAAHGVDESEHACREESDDDELAHRVGAFAHEFASVEEGDIGANESHSHSANDAANEHEEHVYAYERGDDNHQIRQDEPWICVGGGGDGVRCFLTNKYV